MRAFRSAGMKPSTSFYLEVRGLRYHVRSWGRVDAPKIFMLHGWMDVSASFQFIVDALSGDWHVLAPDWRGYGRTDWTKADCYWYPDYLADLERVLEHFQPDEPVNLVGHSMGGNVAGIYAGVRPHRIARIVNLEGLGMRDNEAGDAPKRYAHWLDNLADDQRFRAYGSFDELASRLCEKNPRLRADRAAFLARHWGCERGEGRVELVSDPAHKRVNPVLYRVPEIMACLRNITAPMLWMQGEHSELLSRLKISEAELASRKQCVRKITDVVIPEAGHMLHHDQPERVAEAIERFLT